MRIEDVLPPLWTLAIGFAGGLAFFVLGLPAPWLSGPGTATAIASLAGFKVVVPKPLRLVALVFLGILAGSAVTPETLGQMGRWPLSIIGLAVCVGLIMISIATYLERVHGYDRVTARLSAVPGALPYVLAMAAESNGDVRRIAIVQTFRLVALLVFLPSILAMLGMAGKPGAAVSAAAAARMEASPWELVVLAVAGVAGGWICERLKGPAPYLFGSMVATSILTGSGLVTIAVPAWMTIPGLVIIGTMVGTNFAGTDIRILKATLAAAAGSLAVGTMAAMAVAVPVGLVLGIPVAQVWLAYAPGGVDVMAVMALALGLDAAYVGAHHAVRFLSLGFVVPLWMRADLGGGGSGRKADT